ncbi:MAG: hypothetical protein HPY64_09445 [Anaerolineae bacterium]|nr:hypothetical protein [Anaerolineae bacterium]
METGKWRAALAAVVIIIVALLSGLPGGVVAAQGGPIPTATPFFAPLNDPALIARLDHVEAATAILRDLEPLRPVTRAFLTRPELLDYLRRMLDDEYPPALARADALFYHAFDFMPPDTDLRAVQLAVLDEQIGGFYDPDLQAMFVISAAQEATAMTRILYAHEFTHALQDQHFDLVALGVDQAHFSAAPDAILARQALVEGDAMLLTEGYEAWLLRRSPAAAFDLLGEALGVRTAALLAAPPITQAELLFPYTAGRDFAYALFMKAGGWAGVDAAYARPPDSTEQVLHPDRYLAGDAPLAVALPPLEEALGPGWTLLWERTLGEFTLREHLRQRLPRATADSAAAGWGGDRYRLYVDADGRIVLALRLAWDTAADAAEFAAAYQGYAARLYDSPGFPVDETTLCWYGEDVRCLQHGMVEAVVVRAPERALAMAVLAQVGAGETVKEAEG